MRRLGLATLMLAAGCGSESYVLLELQSELTIPAQVNSLDVETLAYDTREPIAHIDIRLTDERFPMQVLLQPDEDTPSSLEEHVIARLDGQAVAQNVAVLVWQEDRVVRVRLQLLPE